MFTVGAMEGLGSELLADLCTRCHGERYRPEHEADSGDRPHTAMEPCPTCGGTGRRGASPAQRFPL